MICLMATGGALLKVQLVF